MWEQDGFGIITQKRMLWGFWGDVKERHQVLDTYSVAYGSLKVARLSKSVVDDKSTLKM